jgi:hypothetical protein
LPQARIADPRSEQFSFATTDDHSFPKKRRETALGLLMQLLDLRVSGSVRIWLAILELYVAAQQRYATRVSPSCAFGASQSF